MRTILLAALFFSVSASAQDAAPTATTVPAAPAKPAAAAPATSDTGLAPTQRAWLGADYVKLLESIAAGKLMLPRLDAKQGADGESAAIFRRVVNQENLAFHQNRSEPIKARFEDFYMLYRSANALLGQYFTQSGKPGMSLVSEMAHLVAFNIHAAAVGSELADEFMAGIAHDEKYAARKESMQQVASARAMLFIAGEAVLTEKNGMSDADRSLVLTAMSNGLPRVKKNMAPDLRKQLQQKLQDDLPKFAAAADKAMLEKMLQELAH